MTHETSIDRRYSDSRAVPTPWRDAKERMAASGVAWIVSIRPDGRPHATPMIPLVLDGRVFFHTGTREVKYTNISANPSVMVLMGDTEWRAGLDVAFEGQAHEVTDASVLESVVEGWKHAWDGRWRLSVEEGAVVNRDALGTPDLVVFEVLPRNAYAYSKGELFSHSTYRFPPTQTQGRATR